MLRQNFEQCILVLLGPLLKGLCVGVDLPSELNVVLIQSGCKVLEHDSQFLGTRERKRGKHLHRNLVVLHCLSRHATHSGSVL